MLEEIKKEFFEKTYIDGVYNWALLAKNHELKQKIDDLEFGNYKVFQHKVWAIKNNVMELPKCHCGNELPFKSVCKGFRRHCSFVCQTTDIEYQEKRKKRSLEVYGVEHHLKNKKIKEKKIKTNLEKYGVECALQASSIKEKTKKTNLEKYGNENVLQSDIIKEKIKKTFDENYDGLHPKQTTKVKETCKQNNIEKYGVENVYQMQEVKDKIFRFRLEEYKKYILPIRFLELENFNIFPYKWDIDDYKGQSKRYKFIHSECGKVYIGAFYSGRFSLCPHCYSSRSKIEKYLSNELFKIFPNLIPSDRKAISPKEIDILIGNVGIEVNGVYWHQVSKNDTLLEKTKLAEENGIELLHFWDLELYDKMSICKSIICSKLGHFEEKIFARKCKIVNMTNKEATIFFETNHLQGVSKAKYYLGLEYKDEIVMALSISKPRFNKKYDIELHRLASKLGTQVIGGASKLFAQIKKDFVGSKLISYADKRYSQGKIYKSLGFEELLDSKPNYFWVNKQQILPRYSTQKHKLKKLLGEDNFREDLSEDMNMEINGWYKIKDCGNKVFVIKL